MSYSAYVAEVYRAGIQSVHASQRAAALAIGLTGGQALRHVILPQAVRRVVPPLLPELVGEVLAVVRELKAEGMTMVIATHEMEFAREVADEVSFLHEGRVLERGAPDDVLSRPRQPETQRFLRRLLAAR